MAPSVQMKAVAFISPQNHPIIIHNFNKKEEHASKYHYIAHTSLDVIEERVNSSSKATDSYLGLLYSMDDVVVYGYITPLKVKIVIATALTDSVVRDAELVMIFRALHMAYYGVISNPFMKQDYESNDPCPCHLVGSIGWKSFRRRIDEIHRSIGNISKS